MYPTEHSESYLTWMAQPHPVKGHPSHPCACIYTTCELSSGQRSRAERQHHRVAGKVGLDALRKHGHGASAINTKGDNNVQKVILVIVTGEGVSKYVCACSKHTLC